MKCKKQFLLNKIAVSLLVRLWVEMDLEWMVPWWKLSQPPCEAVSWNVADEVRKTLKESQPPCEAVSWNSIDIRTISGCRVSLLVRLWVEIPTLSLYSSRVASASLWGCELKCTSETKLAGITSQPPCEAVSWNASASAFFRSSAVSLLVRLWVEMHMPYYNILCMLRQPPCEAVSWNVFLAYKVLRENVSLLVRLWVEITQLICSKSSLSSASLWGCELKYYAFFTSTIIFRQPPCEAVSWNTQLI